MIPLHLPPLTPAPASASLAERTAVMLRETRVQVDPELYEFGLRMVRANIGALAALGRQDGVGPATRISALRAANEYALELMDVAVERALLGMAESK